jgi:hypothetical protein
VRLSKQRWHVLLVRRKLVRHARRQVGVGESGVSEGIERNGESAASVEVEASVVDRRI